MIELTAWVSRKAEEALVSLLENRHLYQSVRLDIDTILGEARNAGLLEVKNAETALRQALEGNRYSHDEISIQRVAAHSIPEGVEFPPRVAFFVDNIKSPCASCDAITPMNLMRAGPL